MGNNSQGLQGAAGGAMAGSAFGPGGTVAGGLIGGAIGYFGGDGPSRSDYNLPGYEDRQNSLNSAISGAAGANAPTMDPAQIGRFRNAGMGGQFRQGQLGLIGQLQQQAQGQGPSLATGQFNRSLDSGMRAQMAAANSGVGNRALAGRMAAQNIGGMTQDLAGQAAQARIQEQMNARAQLGGILGQGRSQEMQGGQFNAGQQNQRTMAQAGMNQQAGMQNQQAWLRNQAQQNQYGLGLRDLELRNAGGQQSGMQNYAGTQQNQLGTQMLSGGGMNLANRFGNQGPRAPGQPGYDAAGIGTPMSLATGMGGGPSLGGGVGGTGDFGSGYDFQGQFGAPAPVDVSASGITGAQTGYQIPRL